MELMIALAVLGLALAGVYRLFRFWAARVPADIPGAAAILIAILAALLPVILFRPRPRPAPRDLPGLFGEAIGGGIADAVTGMAMLLGVGLAGLLALAMGLGIRQGARRRAGALDRGGPPR
jgi:hypothetical protein